MKAIKFAVALILFTMSMSTVNAQSKTTSVADIKARLKALQPANQAVLRARRDARQLDTAKAYREQIRELRRFIGVLERESLDQGQIVLDPKLNEEPGLASRERIAETRPEIRQRLRNRLTSLNSLMAARREKVKALRQSIGSDLPQKSMIRLLGDIQSELEGPGRMDFATLRKLKDRTILEPALVDGNVDDDTPTISTIIKHRRDL